ncbi:helix-turn-helix domain-containing protein [Bacillus sp. 7894-2]|uniref:helix-turn-helix domain-containing protein n=1 Tax=Bacillus sp. 7894-2 TaxID=2021695 RepID=UPI003369D68B
MSDIAVYIAICKHADNHEPKCNPKISTIAKYARCSERTVRRTVERLVAAGLLKVEHRYNNHGHRASSIYYLLEPK